MTGAYLEYIHLLEQLQVDQVADFLVVAAKLLLIKSEALLPRPPSISPHEEEDVGDDLVKQLLLYKQYKESARKLCDREAAGLHTYMRVAPPPKIEAKLDLSNITVDMLIKAVRNVLEIEPPDPPVGTVVKPFTLTIRDQMNLIERILRYRPNISFKRMLRRARDRVEIIVTFLAVLELLRRHKVEVVQEQTVRRHSDRACATNSTRRRRGRTTRPKRNRCLRFPRPRPRGSPPKSLSLKRKKGSGIG